MRNQSTRSVAAALAAVTVMALLAAAGCSSSTPSATPGSQTPTPSAGTLPPAGGGECDDPTGDILADGPDGPTNVATPAGIDLQHASAKVKGDVLAVDFRTAGAIESVTDPAFFVEHGSGANSDASFELRIEPQTAAPARSWGTLLVTFKAGTQQPSTRITAPVTVADRTVHVDIPLKDLPPIVALVWSFGASSGEGQDALSDDCSTVEQAKPTGTTPGTSEPAPTTPPTTSPPIPFGQTQVYPPTGSKVTVYGVQFPPTNPKPVSVPPSDGMAFAVADAQVCAGDKATDVRSGYFQIKTSDNRLYPIWGVPENVTEPGFPSSQPLQPGDCIRGWVSFQIPIGSTVGAIYYAPDTTSRNYLVWKA